MNEKQYLELEKHYYELDKESEEAKIIKQQLIMHNKELVIRYPFLLPHNRWTGQVDKDYDYTYAELDAMPEGWRIAFAEQMLEELREELSKFNYLNEYRILQIKEKYGSLCWYDGGVPSESKIYDIICKYEQLSERTCIVCGAPATKISLGWISPYCDDCATKFKGHYKSIEEYFGK